MVRLAAAFPAASFVGVACSPRVGVPSIPGVVSGGWWVCAGVIRTASGARFGGACWGGAPPGVVRRSVGLGRRWSPRLGMPFLGVGRGACRAALFLRALSESEDPDVTALSEAVKAKLGIAEPLPKPELSSPSPGLSTLADDLKRSRVSSLLPKVTCPSPFHPRARTVPIAEL